MLGKALLTTMIPVTDVDRAARFYRDTLGLQERPTATGVRTFETAQGMAIALRPSHSGDGLGSGRTLLSFQVDDIAREVDELTARGVGFEDHDLPELTTVGHIADLGTEKVAWFSDSEGNTLCVQEVDG